jgi:arabinofuranosyltransferase
MKVVDSERPGHEKELPLVWIHARYADLDAIGPLPADMQAAAEVLRCGDVAELMAAVEEPVSVSRFLRNVGLSWRLTELRIDPDPFIAREELCGRSP